jgi:hypothetical protein
VGRVDHHTEQTKECRTMRTYDPTVWQYNADGDPIPACEVAGYHLIDPRSRVTSCCGALRSDVQGESLFDQYRVQREGVEG